MTRLTVASLLAAILLHVANAGSPSTVSFAKCSQVCINESQDGLCDYSDIACLCSGDPDFLSKVLICHANRCDGDSSLLMRPLKEICQQVGVGLPSASVASASAMASSYLMAPTVTVTPSTKTYAPITKWTMSSVKPGSLQTTREGDSQPPVPTSKIESSQQANPSPLPGQNPGKVNQPAVQQPAVQQPAVQEPAVQEPVVGGNMQTPPVVKSDEETITVTSPSSTIPPKSASQDASASQSLTTTTSLDPLDMIIPVPLPSNASETETDPSPTIDDVLPAASNAAVANTTNTTAPGTPDEAPGNPNAALRNSASIFSLVIMGVAGYVML